MKQWSRLLCALKWCEYKLVIWGQALLRDLQESPAGRLRALQGRPMLLEAFLESVEPAPMASASIAQLGFVCTIPVVAVVTTCVVKHVDTRDTGLYEGKGIVVGVLEYWEDGSCASYGSRQKSCLQAAVKSWGRNSSLLLADWQNLKWTKLASSAKPGRSCLLRSSTTVSAALLCRRQTAELSSSIPCMAVE